MITEGYTLQRPEISISKPMDKNERQIHELIGKQSYPLFSEKCEFTKYLSIKWILYLNN